MKDTKDASKQLHATQRQRQLIQEQLSPQFNKLIQKKQNSIIRLTACQKASIELEQLLKDKGFEYEKYLARMDADAKAESNGTIKEYEMVNSTEVDYEQPLKKSRIA